MQIYKILASEVLDSRGNPTLKAKVMLSDGSVGVAIVPSGASTGKREALELRDSGQRFLGKGVLKACGFVEGVIQEALVGLDPYNQSHVDSLLQKIDGTENYAHLGANASLGVSLALARASACSLHLALHSYLGGINGLTLPTPMLNIINGGAHANNNLDFQEYMIMPLKFESFKEALRASVEVYHTLKNMLVEAKQPISVGDEGGFAPNFKNNKEPLDWILKAIEKAGYQPGEQIALALDIASSELMNPAGRYVLSSENKELEASALIEYYDKLLEKYPIVSIEDALGEEDYSGWAELSAKLGQKVQLVGDDLFVTNSKLLQKGIEAKLANAILIKPNQIGTLSQTIQTMHLAQKSGYACVMSHRSGESEDSFIADFAVALNTGQIKTGAPTRGERTAKYNRLLEIEDSIEGIYAGPSLF
ncbi:phosphopyruvate hydratase [Helicobacter suis]|uniref:Enolase n=2 Tax=Helicobacter suis TaxID=104628 RepID=E7G345_9HELI|nr:phosphopyruvate hydratase [Helicobacter suis]EFX42192.1 phosphopyruvate hydratase [Helicobacter suis HS5]BCD45620.1 Enolase Eno [Helicobacter suis]BCD47319.1 Enolase Eno [Helicobacter suis]BCD49073.1 Enolase Eno [Helicobacter suis]BCD50819.1 Enolase Eno [Helicobacter suis]